MALFNLVRQTSDRKITKNLETFISPASSITLGTPIIFNHGFVNLAGINSITSTVYLVNVFAQHGYQPGENVTPDRGISVSLTISELIIYPASNGVFVVRKDNGKSNKINPDRWSLLISTLLL